MTIVALSYGQVYRAGETELLQLVYSMAIMSRATTSQGPRAFAQAPLGGTTGERRKAEAHQDAPSRLQLSSDRSTFELIPDRVDVVRRIFKLSAEGLGTLLSGP